jgi:outer membrane receptor protein involved in Fe transport
MRKRDERAGVSLRALMSVVLGASAALTAAPAWAQDEEEEEIVVTATRRDQTLQDVPIAVTPVGAEMIQNSGIRDIQDLTSVAPSLQFNVSESEASATARLRGVGTQGSNPGLESAVGIFIDGVYRARNGVALTDLGDLQQIEVLRGPQGTLFGRNTSAGLITIATVQPNVNDYEFGGELTYGAFDERRASASVNFPLAPGVAGFRLFGAWAERDGFLDTNADGTNPLLGPSVANQDSGDSNSRGVWTVRGQLLWQLTDNLEMRAIADFSERDETCCGAQIYNPVLLNGNPVTNMGPTGLEGAPIAYGTGRQQWVANLGGYGPNVNGTTPLGALGAGNIDDRQAFSNYGYPASVEDYGVSTEFNWDLDGDVTLTAIFAYRVWSSGGGSDSDYSQADLVYVPQGDAVGTEYRTLTQEFRLAGENGRLNWLVGAFLSDEEIDRSFAFATGAQYGTYFAGLDSIISGGTVAPGLGVAPVGGSLPTLYNALALVPANAGSRDTYAQNGFSWAIFTHNIFALSDQTDLTVGVRFTHEEKNLTADFNTLFSAAPLRGATITGLESAFLLAPGTLAPFNNCNPTLLPGGSLGNVFRALRAGYCVPWLRDELDGVGYDQSRTEEEWSGVVSLRHEFTDNIAAYVSASRGYKAGGFNLDRDFDFTIVGGQPTSDFAAELVDAYEIGFKTEWFDRRLLVNLAIYQNEYENFQLNTYNGIQFVVTSIPEVTSQGAEIDVIWRTPIDGLSLQGGVAYTDATYGENDGWVEANRDPILANLTLARLPGSQLTNAPEWTSTISATYERSIFDNMRFLAYADARWVDEQSTGSDLRPSKTQPSYGLINARLGIGSADERWTLELWGRNILDEEYVQVAFDVPLQQGTAGPTQGAFLGDPATYGVTLRARY